MYTYTNTNDGNVVERAQADDRLDELDNWTREGEAEPLPEPEPAPAPEVVVRVVALEQLDDDQLRTYAAAHDIDLGRTTAKDKVIATILTAGDVVAEHVAAILDGTDFTVVVPSETAQA